MRVSEIEWITRTLDQNGNGKFGAKAYGRLAAESMCGSDRGKAILVRIFSNKVLPWVFRWAGIDGRLVENPALRIDTNSRSRPPVSPQDFPVAMSDSQSLLVL